MLLVLLVLVQLLVLLVLLLFFSCTTTSLPAVSDSNLRLRPGERAVAGNGIGTTFMFLPLSSF
jgi:hypothetical protein